MYPKIPAKSRTPGFVSPQNHKLGCPSVNVTFFDVTAITGQMLVNNRNSRMADLFRWEIENCNSAKPIGYSIS